ncbi:MAG: DUF502 domain-containing protein [Firmicutes bacterium]|nr:DUF502 domain-containing protein [Bacillota bacterium]
MSKFRNYFLTGLVFLLPAIITGYTLLFAFRLLDNFMGNIVLYVFGHTIQGLGFILSMLAIIATGALGGNILGRRVLRFGEKILEHVPVVKGLYLGSKQLTRSLFGKNASSFRRVVCIEYPRKGIYTLGFVTGELPLGALIGNRPPAGREPGAGGPEGTEQVKDESAGALLPEGRVFSVFVPTTPNPTSGFMVVVPEKDACHVDLSVEDGIRLIISGGALKPAKWTARDK